MTTWGARRPDAAQRVSDRLRSKHHPLSAAIGRIIHMPVPIERKIAEINGLKFHFARIDGSLDDAGRRKRVKEFWEDGDHRDLHNNPSIASDLDPLFFHIDRGDHSLHIRDQDAVIFALCTRSTALAPVSITSTTRPT